MRWLAPLMCMGLIAAGVQAQDALVNGPTLGFTAEKGGAGIRPIIGIPGASSLADRLQFDVEIRGATISPNQDYAIAARSQDGQVILIDLRRNTPVLIEVAGTYAGADRIAISPSGTVAAVYNAGARLVQVIGSLPDAPELIQQFDASRISGTAASIAINDSGSIALMKFVDADGTKLWVMDRSGASWPIPADQPSAAAFFPHSSDAIVADGATQSAFVMMDLSGAAVRVPLVSGEPGMTGFSAVSASQDARRIFLADGESGHIAVVDLETRRPVRVSCRCRATGFYRLKGNSIFRLTEATSEPMMVLDASSAEPRIVIVPPAAAAEETPPSEDTLDRSDPSNRIRVPTEETTRRGRMRGL